MSHAGYTTDRFKNISDDMNKIVDELLKNKNLLKWITYIDDDPMLKPDVPPNTVLGKNIILTRMNETVLKELYIKVFITPITGSDHRLGILTDTVFEIAIAVPTQHSYSYATRKHRASEIASEVASSLDDKHITGLGEVKVSSDFHNFKVNEKFGAMALRVSTTNTNTKAKAKV